MICQTCVSLFRPSELFNISVPRVNQVPREAFLFILIWLFHSCKVRLNCHRVTPCVYSFSCESSLVLYLSLYLFLYLSFSHLRSFSSKSFTLQHGLKPQYLNLWEVVPHVLISNQPTTSPSSSHLETGKFENFVLVTSWDGKVDVTGATPSPSQEAAETGEPDKLTAAPIFPFFLLFVLVFLPLGGSMGADVCCLCVEKLSVYWLALMSRSRDRPRDLLYFSDNHQESCSSNLEHK